MAYKYFYAHEYKNTGAENFGPWFKLIAELLAYTDPDKGNQECAKADEKYSINDIDIQESKSNPDG